MSPEPVTAWLVQPRNKGGAGAVTLRLEGGVLLLSTPEEKLRLEAGAIIRVRQGTLTPVISITYREGGRVRNYSSTSLGPPSTPGRNDGSGLGAASSGRPKQSDSPKPIGS